MAADVPNIKLKIDPQDLQIQTFTVRKLLEPLIIQVSLHKSTYLNLKKGSIFLLCFVFIELVSDSV
uniref:Uncharacterized protein n=1 Tax=Crocodylus porosus TaxID=8502 RepID=A0A7M4EFM7_CROPO